MVRITEEISFADGKKIISAYGLSTDSKPTTGIATGSSFVAVDTGKVYLYNESGTSWEEQ